SRHSHLNNAQRIADLNLQRAGFTYADCNAAVVIEFHRPLAGAKMFGGGAQEKLRARQVLSDDCRDRDTPAAANGADLIALCSDHRPGVKNVHHAAKGEPLELKVMDGPL